MEKEVLEQYITNGYSQREIAKLENCSQSTVRHWLERHKLKTYVVHHGKFSGRYIQSKCKIHGDTQFIFETSRNAYRCVACRSGRVSEARRKLKEELVLLAGGSCIRCGYNKNIWALQFDHRNPVEKTYTMALLVRDRKRKLALQELKKCDLLCANCHAEKTSEDTYGPLAESVQALG